VVFSPDGGVHAVSVSPPFAGTPVGRCVAGIFRGATVPPFRGSPASLTQGFTVPH
jgi:hypothetical protein